MQANQGGANNQSKLNSKIKYPFCHVEKTIERAAWIYLPTIFSL